MVKLVAAYSKPKDPADFDSRYFGTHVPLARKIPGLKEMKVFRVKGGPAGEAPYYLLAELFFDDMPSLKAGMSSPEGQAAGKNLMSFAKDYATFLFAEEA